VFESYRLTDRQTNRQTDRQTYRTIYHAASRVVSNIPNIQYNTLEVDYSNYSKAIPITPFWLHSVASVTAG